MRRGLALLAGITAACAAGAPAPKPAPPRAPAFATATAAPASPALAAPDQQPSSAAIETTLADFFGKDYPPALPSAPHGRVGSLTWGTWIQPGPRSGSLPLGSIRVGGSLPLLSAEREPGQGRCAEFVKVERGYVCVGPRSTLDERSRWLDAGRWVAPAPGVMPFHYALSLGAPMLTRPVPREKMLWKVGSREVPRMRGWNAGHDELAEDAAIEPNGPIPDFLRDGGQTPMPWGAPKGVYFKMVPFGSMVAYTRAFEAEGEVWVLTTDMAVVPARGLKRFRVSSFHGAELGHGVELPIAWMRKQARPKWRRTVGGFERTDQSWPAKSMVALTGSEVKQAKRRFLETREAGLFLERSDATVVEKRAKPPWETHGTGKWIHIRVNRGTFTLYEGPNPIFSTLMSPGKEDATPYGRYFLESKHHFSTMSTEESEPTKFWISAVPWTMYFKRPYAIHASYWHEDFGQRKSGGCVNLSPLDAKRVFDWADPKLPEGWDTVQAPSEFDGTFVLVEG